MTFGLLLLFLTTAPRAHGQEWRPPNELEQRIAGCYELEVGEWVERPGIGAPSYAVPDRVELTLEPAQSEGSWRLDSANPPFESGIWPAWAVSSADSLELAWSTGFDGFVVQVDRPRAAETTGLATTSSDDLFVETDKNGVLRPLPPPSQAPVRLIRIDCSGITASVDRLTWLAGCWQGVLSSGSIYEEVWLRPRAGTILGMSRTVRDNRTVSFEFMRIVDDDDALVFIAEPSGQETAEFRAIEVTSAAATFENPEHDFPQRILYRLNPPDELVARIEGNRDGEVRGIELPMRRAACAD